MSKACHMSEHVSAAALSLAVPMPTLGPTWQVHHNVRLCEHSISNVVYHCISHAELKPQCKSKAMCDSMCSIATVLARDSASRKLCDNLSIPTEKPDDLGIMLLRQAFDFETGLPKRCVKMVSWPIMDRLSRPFWEHLGRAALESFVPTKTTEGFLVMFDRSAAVARDKATNTAVLLFAKQCYKECHVA